jgi:type IV pilus assembly protein PilV
MKPMIAQIGSKFQRGSMLLEALIGILIFSLGVLAIVGMQAASIKNSSESKYRSDANLLANQLIGQMWASDRTTATLSAAFQGGNGTDGAGYTSWVTNEIATALPGVAANPPSVSVDAASGLVTIIVYWQSPSDTATGSRHNYTTVAQIQ